MESLDEQNIDKFAEDFSVAMINFGQVLKRILNHENVDSTEFNQFFATAFLAAAIDAEHESRLDNDQVPSFALSLSDGLRIYADIELDPAELTKERWNDLFFQASASVRPPRKFTGSDEDLLHIMTTDSSRIRIKAS